MVVTDSRKNQYQLKKSPKFSGGEGAIFEIEGNPKMLAKVYHEYERQDFASLDKKFKKLIALLHTRPKGGQAEHFSWPLDAIYIQGQFVGFLMKKLEISSLLYEIYEFNPRETNTLSWSQKVHLARNMCAGLDSIHNTKQVIGDFNPQNIAINRQSGYVYFLDNDSFHIHFDGIDYPCLAGVAEYLPPEIQARKAKGQCDIPSLSLPTFTQEGDRFSLALHIFRLLMNGVHPYHQGRSVAKYKRSLAVFRPHQLILKGQSVFFNPPMDMAPPIYAPPVSILPPYIQDMFKRALIEGHSQPTIRPTAAEWFEELTKLLNEKELKTCHLNPKHDYWKENNECPWCVSERSFKEQFAVVNQTVIKQTRFVRGKRIVRPVQTYSTKAKTPNTIKYKFIKWGSITLLAWIVLSIFLQGFFPTLNVFIFSWPGQFFYLVVNAIWTILTWIVTLIGWILAGIFIAAGFIWQGLVLIYDIVVYLVPIIFNIMGIILVFLWDMIVWIFGVIGAIIQFFF